MPRSLFWWWPPSGLVDSGNRLCDAIAAAVRHVSYSISEGTLINNNKIIK